MLLASNLRVSAGSAALAPGGANASLAKGAAISFTLFVTDNLLQAPSTQIPAGATIAVAVTVAPLSAPSSACPFSAARFATGSTAGVFFLSASSPTVNVTLVALADVLINGNACAVVSAAVLPTATTALAFASGVAPWRGLPVVSVDTNVAGISLALAAPTNAASSSSTPALTDAAGASIVLLAALTASPGSASVPVTLAASPALSLSPSSFTLTAANWRDGVSVVVRANTAISFAVPAPLSITASSAASTAIGGVWAPGTTSVQLVRLSTLLPVIVAPTSVTKGGSAAVQVSLRAVPPAAFGATASLQTFSAPMNAASLSISTGSGGTLLSFPASVDALETQTILLAFASNPFASARETTQVCLAVQGFAQPVCSGPIALVDTVQPGISPVTAQTLVSGEWATYLPDNVTVRLQEGATTLLSFGVTTGLVGTVTASLSNNASVYASIATAVATISNALVPATLAVTGKVITTPAAAAADTSRRGLLTIRLLATAASSASASATGLVDSGYASPVFAFVPYVLVSPGTPVVAAAPPAIAVSVPAGAIITEGGTGVQANVSISPPITSNQVVTLLLALPPRAEASSTALTFSSSSLSWALVTLTAPDDGIAWDSLAPLAFSVSVSTASTTAIAYLAAPQVSFSVNVQDLNAPTLVISGTRSATAPTLAIAENGPSASFGVSWSYAPPLLTTVSVSVASATGVCGAPSTALAFTAPCYSNSDCGGAASQCVFPSTLLPFKLASAPAAALFFNSSNYNVPQLLPVTALQEGIADGPQTGLVRLIATAGPSSFLAAPAVSVRVAITDADTPGVVLAAVGPILEATGQGQAVITLKTVPLAPVTVSIVSGDAQVSVTPASFSTAGGSRSVLVKVAQSSVARGAGADNVFPVQVTLALSSLDPAYNNRTVSATLAVVDMDTRGLAVTALSSAAAEGGSSLARLRVSLKSQPLAPVTVTFTEVASSVDFGSLLPDLAHPCTPLPTSGSQFVPLTPGDPAETPVVASVVIAPSAWFTPVDVFVAARADARIEGTIAVSVSPSTASADPAYNAIAGMAAVPIVITEFDLAPPPLLPTVQFANDYASALVTFSQPVSVAGSSASSDCTRIFTITPSAAGAPTAARLCANASFVAAADIAATVAALGAGQKCFVASATSVVVQFGARPTVSEGDLFVLLAGAVRWNSSALLFASGSVPILAAPSPPKPTVVFGGNLSVVQAGLCDVAFIAGAISNTGGRPYTLSWAAADGSAPVTPALAATVAAANAAQAVGISVDATCVAPGASAALALTVTNWLGISSTASLTFSRTGLSPPMLSMPAPTTVMRSAGLQAAVRGQLSACGNASTSAGSLVFFWSALSSTSILPSYLGAGAAPPAGSPALGGTFLGALLNARSVAILPTDLQAATYTFAVAAAPSTNLAAVASGTFSVTVVYDPLVAAIAGGAGSLAQAGASYVLDGSQSGEPTAVLRAAQTGVSFAWACAVATTGADCSASLSSLTGATTVLSADVMTPGMVFTVSLAVSAPGRATASASQTVTVSGTPVPTLSLAIKEPFVAGTANTVAGGNSLVTLTATATLAGVSAFSFTFASTTIPASLLDSGNASVVAIAASSLAPGASYTVCVAAQSFRPVASQGQVCTSFSTAALPTVGSVAVTLASAATHSYSVTVSAVGSAVSSLVFAYLPVPLAAALALATAQGPDALSVFNRGDAATSGVLTALLPSGNISVCVFGVTSAGGYAVSCAAASIAPVVLSSSATASLLASAGNSGDVTSILGSINYVNSASSAGSGLTRLRRQLATSPSTQSTIITLLQSAYASTVADGTGSQIATVLSTLAGSSSSIASAGDATLAAQCLALAQACVASMNAFSQQISAASWSSAATALLSCGSPQAAAVSALLQGLSGGAFQASFSVTVNGVFVGGSSGLSRAAIVAGAATVSSLPVAASAATAPMPAIVVSSGGMLTVPAGTVALTDPLEVQVLGMPLPTAAAAAGAPQLPLFSIAFTGVSAANAAAVAGAYTAASGATAFDGIATASLGAGAFTIFATHNSTFYLAQAASPASVIVSAFGSGAAFANASVREGAALALYVRLGAQPQASVSVAIALPAGVCYSTATNAMASAGGLAVTCDLPGVVDQCATGQDCRAQLATFSPAGPLVFTPANWATSQPVSVRGTLDSVFEPDAAVVGTMTFTPSSADTRFDSGGVCTSAACSAAVANAGASIEITVVDTSVPAVIVGAIAPSSISEASAAPATYSVSLGSAPKAAVTVSAASAATFVTLPTASLTFTPATWSVPQTFSVQPVSDSYVHSVRIAAVTHTVASTDAAYAALTPAGASLSVTDSNVAGYSLTRWSPSMINEGGGVSTAVLTLSAQPASVLNITFALTANAATSLSLSGQGVVGSSVLVQPASWSSPIALSLTSTSLGVPGPNAAVLLSASSTCADAAFNGLRAVAGDLTVLNQFAIGILPAIGANPTLSADSTLTYTVTLQSSPPGAVTVNLAVAAPAASAPFPAPFSVSPSSLVFDAGLGQVPQQVTLTGAANQIAYPLGLAFTVLHSVAANSDASYLGVDPVAVSVGWASANAASLLLSPAAVTLTTVERTGSLTLALGSAPVTNVTVQVAAQPGVVLPAGATYVLNASTWQGGVAVPIELDDSVAHGTSVAVTASSGGAGAGDYALFTVSSVDVSVTLPLPSPTASPTGTPTASVSASVSVTSSISQSASVSRTSSTTASLSATPSPTASLSPGASPSSSPSVTPSGSASASPSPSLTRTGSASPTGSLSAGASSSPSASASRAPSAPVIMTSLLFEPPAGSGGAIDPAALADPAFVAAVEASFAAMLGVNASDVQVAGVQAVTVAEINASAASAAGGHRRARALQAGNAVAGYRVLVAIRAAAAAASPALAAAVSSGQSLAASISAAVSAGVASGSLVQAIASASPASVSALGYASAAALIASVKVDPTRPTLLVAAPPPRTLPGASAALLSDGATAGVCIAAVVAIMGVGAAIRYAFSRPAKTLARQASYVRAPPADGGAPAPTPRAHHAPHGGGHSPHGGRRSSVVSPLDGGGGGGGAAQPVIVVRHADGVSGQRRQSKAQPAERRQSEARPASERRPSQAQAQAAPDEQARRKSVSALQLQAQAGEPGRRKSVAATDEPGRRKSAGGLQLRAAQGPPPPASE